MSQATGKGALHALAISSEYFFRAEPQLVKAEIAERFGLPTRITLMWRQDRLIESGDNSL